ITASFDFRLFSTNLAADGFHFMLVPTTNFGLTGDGPNVLAEEPNLVDTLAVGIDVHPAATVNDLSLHWDGFENVNARPNPVLGDLDNGLFHRLRLMLNRVGNGSVARLDLIPDIFGTNALTTTTVYEVFVPMLPYENRVQFGGRTGGLDMDIDIDNIFVHYTNFFTGGIPVIVTNGFFQDFDRVGGTDYVPIQHVGAFSTNTPFVPGPMIRNDGDSHTNFLRLVNDLVGNNRNSLAFDHLGGPALAPAVHRYGFDFRVASSGFAADGFSLSLIPTALQGMRGRAVEPVPWEEPNLSRALGIGFDLHPEDLGANDISLHWDGAVFTNRTLNLTNEIDLNNGVWNRGDVEVAFVGGGAEVSVTLLRDVDGTNVVTVPVYDRVFIPGAYDYEHRIQVGGRTGGRFLDLDVDNFAGSKTFVMTTPDCTVQDFDTTGAYYEVWRSAGSSLVTPEIRNDGGPNGAYLHLLNAGTVDQRNSMTFMTAPHGTDAAPGLFTVGKLDFRISGGDPNNPADGFAFMLISTNAYGSAGPGAMFQTGYIGIEEPNFVDVFAVG
ncbi:MAG: hypothetical protein AAF492_18520, partial [Verrucomicrobiota bacterium]